MMQPADLRRERDDIQAMLRTGFNQLTDSAYWLLTIDDIVLARKWLSQLLGNGLVKSAAEVGRQARASEPLPEAVCIAFTGSGLSTLGVVASTDFPFSSPFVSGMSSPIRERLMRDDSRDDWEWGDTASGSRPLIHILVLRWWDPVRLATSAWIDPGPANGFTARCVNGDPAAFAEGGVREPFGFRDGVSQPSLAGFTDEDSAGSGVQVRAPAGTDHDIAPGEFILGHPNQYREASACPDVTGWSDSSMARHGSRFGLNGSYLAVRQIEQDVAGFAALAAGPYPSAPGCPASTSVSERMIGRRQDAPATPLGWNAHSSFSKRSENFGYRLEDGDGFLCAHGAHVRRVNPRDSLGHDAASGLAASKLHRLLRRGRSYVDHVEGNADAGLRRGIFFIACNADLERQFEFVHQRWLRNPRFGGFGGTDDPIVGSAFGKRRLSVPGIPLGSPARLASFTRAVGGGYFFLPGLRALRFVVCRDEQAAASPPHR